jgi:hypothetical protein
MKIDKKIKDVDRYISKFIDKIKESNDDSAFYEAILSRLRTLIEYIFLKIYSFEKHIEDFDDSYNNIKIAKNYIAKNKLKNYGFLIKYHTNFASVIHKSLNEENSKRLFFQYYEKLLKIKFFLKEQYDIEIFKNIEDISLKNSSNLNEYYEKISIEILKNDDHTWNNDYFGKYYITKIKPFFINKKIFYEVTLTEARNNINKFNNRIAFTNIELLKNYSVEVSIISKYITINNKKIPILFINNYKVSIRICELNNLSLLLFGKNNKLKLSSNLIEYKNMMKFLSETKFTLLDIIRFDDEIYNFFIEDIFKNSNTNYLIKILTFCRNIINQNIYGKNIISYLLYNLKNRIILNQRASNEL